MEALEKSADVFRNEKPRIADALKNFCSVLAANDLASGADLGKQHDMSHLLACARVTSKLINGYTPPPAEASDRDDKLDREACHLLALQCKQHGGKVTKLLGRGYLRTSDCFGAGGLRDAADAALTAQRLPPQTVSSFLDGWVASIAGGDAEAEQLVELVWAEDLPRTLQARRNARQAEVSQRRERMGSTESELQALRDAMHEEDRERIVDITSEDRHS